VGGLVDLEAGKEMLYEKKASGEMFLPLNQGGRVTSR